jgi:hypothetical protein
MTPSELYRYDLRGYLYIENAIEPNLLKRLNERMDFWQAEGRRLLDTHARATSKPKLDWRINLGWDAATSTVRPQVEFYDIVNQDEAFVDLIVNPRVLPYIDEMVQNPRLKSNWLALKWKGGRARDTSNHTPSSTCNFYHFNGGRIYHNLFQVFYAISDVPPRGGGMRLIPGSHKANIPLPKDDGLEDLEVEIPMRAGSVLLFSHDVYHASLNTTDTVRRVAIFTYCPGVIANSWAEPGNTMYDRLFERAPEGSWMKYLLRRPQGAGETYSKPVGRPYDAG